LVYPPIAPLGHDDAFPGPGAGFYPHSGIGGGGSMHVGNMTPTEHTLESFCFIFVHLGSLIYICFIQQVQTIHASFLLIPSLCPLVALGVFHQVVVMIQLVHQMFQDLNLLAL
jgi:hypothetical protein